MADGVRIWTEPQRAAIDSREKTILVSAAAGSGKTAVLTQRIIERLTDNENPGDISRMLVVTFTRAAAAELRERIGSALKAEMLNSPQFADRLREQYLLLSGAKISTVHSFCLDVIKSKFALLGLSSKVRVLDDGQAKLMSRRIMNEVIESRFEADDYDNGVFASFTENLINLHDEGLADLLCKIYDKVSSFSDGIDFVKKSADDYLDSIDKEFNQTKWSRVALNEFRMLYSSYAAVCSAACRAIAEDPTFIPYLPAFENDLQHAETVLSKLEIGLEEAMDDIEYYKAVPLGRVKTELQTEEIKFFRSLRTDFSSTRGELFKKYFSETPYFFQNSAKQSYKFCMTLYSVLSEYQKRYSAEKNKRSVLDYADLERLTMNLLISEGKPTSTALE